VKNSAANVQMTVKGNVDQGKAVVTGVTIKSDDGKTMRTTALAPMA
jgi:GTPase